MRKTRPSKTRQPPATKKTNILLLIMLLLCIVSLWHLAPTQTTTTHTYANAEPAATHSPSYLLPRPVPQINRSSYTLGYDGRTKNAFWVYERLTKEALAGKTERDEFQFAADTVVPKAFRATLADYKGSSYDRRHLAPAANHRASPEKMADTFILSNISPQDPKFNRGYWAKLEKHVRNLTHSYDVVHVITGPLYLPEEDKQGKRWIKYQVIGENDVAVPTHFFKVLFLEKRFSQTVATGYVLPNKGIDASTPLERFQTSIQKIEKVSGLLFPQPSATKEALKASLS